MQSNNWSAPVRTDDARNPAYWTAYAAEAARLAFNDREQELEGAQMDEAVLA